MITPIAKESFKALADALPSLVFVANAEGESIYCNRQLQEFTGLEEAGLLGGAWILSIHEEDRSSAKTAWRQAIAAGEPYEAECRLRAKDGHFHWFLIRCVPVRSKGNVEHWVATCTDIDDRKLSIDNAIAEYERTRAALKVSEARYRAVFQSTCNFVVLLTTKGVVIEANDAALDFGDMTSAEVIGQKFWDTLWWGRDHEAKVKLGEAIAAVATGKVGRYEANVLPANKKAAVIGFTLEPVVEETGAIRQIIFEGHDLTYLKSVEADLTEAKAAVSERHAAEQRLHADLRRANERLVQEMKRREAMQSALLQSQKLEALGQITANVAHDFNNVLAAILGGFSLIQSRTDDVRLQKLTSEGIKAVDRGAGLIRGLLAFAKQQDIIRQKV